MVSEGFMIKYKGFAPDEKTEDQMRRLIEVLRCEAPSESWLRATYAKFDGGYTGTLRVNTSQGSFFARDREVELVLLAGKLIEKVRRQFAHWKKVRFLFSDDPHDAYRQTSVLQIET